MLCVLGDLVEDVVVRLDSGVRLATDTPARIERSRGGSAANVAALAAADGTTARFIGQVGDDAVGERLTSRLAADGVDVRVRRSGRTGTIVVLVDAVGERTMLSDRGAAVELIDVPDDWLAGVTWLHLPAYSLTVEPLRSTAHLAVARVRAAGARLSVDLSSVSVVERYGPARFSEDLAVLAPDVVFANTDEAELLPPVAPHGIQIVKRGAAPVEVRLPAGDVELVAVDTVREVIDTTGAGDAFAAGFIGSQLRGATPVAAARAGSAVAARVLGTLGASLARPADRTR